MLFSFIKHNSHPVDVVDQVLVGNAVIIQHIEFVR